MDINKLENFVSDFYTHKDIMHDLGHIKQVLKMAQEVSAPYEDEIDKDLIIYGAYFHGVIYVDEIREQIIQYLQRIGLSDEKIQDIIQVSIGSQKDEVPEILEAKILHDAHLLEGGQTYLIVKSLITGSVRGQTLEETIDIIENRILGRFTCYLPENKRIYKEKEEFARQFLNDLKPFL